MSTRRLRALQSLERLKGLDIDREVPALVKLRSEMDRLTADRDALQARLIAESHASTPEAAVFVGDFVRAMRAEIGILDARIAALTPDLDRVETRIRDLFREKAAFESVRHAGEVALRAERAAREDADLSDLFLMRWQRPVGA